MTVRTTKMSVTFVNPFVLGDFDEVLPPGTYDVENDEALLEGLSFHAYRRIRTVIHLPPKPGRGAFSRRLTIDPDVLDAALTRDEASSAAGPERAPVRKPPGGSPNARAFETDRQAVDRAENEGMIVHPH